MGQGGFEPPTSGCLRQPLNQRPSYKTGALTRLSYWPSYYNIFMITYLYFLLFINIKKYFRSNNKLLRRKIIKRKDISEQLRLWFVDVSYIQYKKSLRCIDQIQKKKT